MRQKFRKRHLRLWVKLFLLASVGLSVFLIINAYFTPLLTVLAKDKAISATTQAMNLAVCEELQNMSYDDLVHIERASDNSVLSVQTDAVNVNNLKSLISLNIQNKLENNNNDYSIPLGTLTGIGLLTGTGWNIDFKTAFLSSVVSDLKSEFSSAGINQTKHTVYFEIECCITLLLPNYNEDLTIKNNVNVAETIIVGNVPQVCANI